ncbi:MAG TPA: hypothetical protein VGJ26_03210 [Pirellulales bacterium]|jgi:hypothetical protein
MNVGRHSLVSLLLALLYGGTMLFGQSLHALLDCGHDHGPSHDHEPAIVHSHTHPHEHAPASFHGHEPLKGHNHGSPCGCEHVAHHDEHSQDDHAKPHDCVSDARIDSQEFTSPMLAAPDELTAHASDCPICQFHSQGQLRAAEDSPAEQPLPALSISRTTPLVAAEFALGVHSPRGPPA